MQFGLQDYKKHLSPLKFKSEKPFYTVSCFTPRIPLYMKPLTAPCHPTSTKEKLIARPVTTGCTLFPRIVDNLDNAFNIEREIRRQIESEYTGLTSKQISVLDNVIEQTNVIRNHFRQGTDNDVLIQDYVFPIEKMDSDFSISNINESERTSETKIEIKKENLIEYKKLLDPRKKRRGTLGIVNSDFESSIKVVAHKLDEWVNKNLDSPVNLEDNIINDRMPYYSDPSKLPAIGLKTSQLEVALTSWKPTLAIGKRNTLNVVDEITAPNEFLKAMGNIATASIHNRRSIQDPSIIEKNRAKSSYGKNWFVDPEIWGVKVESDEKLKVKSDIQARIIKIKTHQEKEDAAAYAGKTIKKEQVVEDFKRRGMLIQDHVRRTVIVDKNGKRQGTGVPYIKG